MCSLREILKLVNRQRAFLILAVGLIAAATLISQVRAPSGSMPAGQVSANRGAPMVDIRLPAVLSADAQLGKAAFDANCAECHGENAAGQQGAPHHWFTRSTSRAIMATWHFNSRQGRVCGPITGASETCRRSKTSLMPRSPTLRYTSGNCSARTGSSDGLQSAHASFEPRFGAGHLLRSDCATDHSAFRGGRNRSPRCGAGQPATRRGPSSSERDRKRHRLALSPRYRLPFPGHCGDFPDVASACRTRKVRLPSARTLRDGHLA